VKLKEVRLSGTTSAGGALTVNSTIPILGRLFSVQWIDGTFDNGVDGIISTQGHQSSKTLLTVTDGDDDALYYPRDLVHDETGAALTGTQGGDRAMPLMVGTLRLVVSDGGNAKTGGCIVFYVED
jgi:hypothetical protein